MRRSLTFKLTAAFLGVSALAIALVALFSGIAAAMEFNRFLSQEAQSDFIIFVSDYYATKGNLSGIDEALRGQLEPHPGQAPAPRRFFTFALANPQGIVVLPGDGYRVGFPAPETQVAAGTKILVNGQVVGVVLPFTRPLPRNRAAEQFLERTGSVLALSMLGAAGLAILLGVLLARTITQPVRDLTNAARRMAKGDLAQTVQVQSRDEVGELATAFNQMSADLARADRTRRQMTADIAHELRNPLTVIGGYLDAMRSGDMPPTPARLEAVYDEVEHLESIVEDLRTLSLAEAGALILNYQTVHVDDLLGRVAARFALQAAQKNITLSVNASPSLAPLRADEARLTQVLDNLVSNSLQHTPGGGSILLAAKQENGIMQIRIEDTGEGIPDEELPRIFERFYRGDSSRSTEDGSSGLGLAIVKALVQAHGGHVRAESRLGYGSTLFVELPLEA